MKNLTATLALLLATTAFAGNDFSSACKNSENLTTDQRRIFGQGLMWFDEQRWEDSTLGELEFIETLVKEVDQNKQLCDGYANLVGIVPVMNFDYKRDGVKDFSLVSIYPNVSILRIGNSPLTIFKGIEGLQKLTRLEISDSKFKHIPAISSFNNLEFLTMTETPVEDLSPIKNLSSLEKVDVSFGNVKNLDFLKKGHKLHALSEINLYKNNLEKIDGIETLKNLGILVIGNNKVKDISVLYKTDLGILDLSSNPVVDSKAIAANKNLVSLYVDYTKITNLKPFKKLKYLLILSTEGL